MGAKTDTGYLDGLRALAAFWVLAAHCLIWGGYSGPIPNAKIAVAVFMVLSGYLMALTAKDFAQPSEWRRFYLRRFFRLAPVYYLVLAALALSPWLREGLAAWERFPPGTYYAPDRADFGLGNLALHASFLFGVSPQTATNTMLPDWSLSLEMQFYAVFPALWLAVRRWGGLRVAAALALPCLVFWVAHRHEWHDPAFLPLQLPYFLAGVLAFEARSDLKLAAPALILAAFEAPTFGSGFLFVPLAVGVIVALDRGLLRGLRSLLANPVNKVAADLSYGVYLVHLPLIAIAGHFRPPLWLLGLTVLLGSVALSWLLHYAVERPAIGLGREIAFKPRGRREEAPT
jgi:peptidoglycan/LPS O-acetylase OafA/YrhL